MAALATTTEQIQADKLAQEEAALQAQKDREAAADLEAKKKAEGLQKQKLQDDLVLKKENNEKSKEAIKKHFDTLTYLFANLGNVNQWYVTSSGDCFETENAAHFGKSATDEVVVVNRETFNNVQ